MTRRRALLAGAFAAYTACTVRAETACAASLPRIVSLMPSMTEDLFAIGAGGQIVGVSDYTDFPDGAKSIPVVSSNTSVDAERIALLHPDLVVGIERQRPLVADLQRIGLRVELFADRSFDDLFATLAALGELSGHAHEAATLAKRLRARTDALVATVPKGPRVRTLVLLGTSPIYTVGDGSYIARLIELAGGSNASGIAEPYARLSAEALLAEQPDVIVADPRGGLEGVRDSEPWRSLRAVRDGRAYVLEDPDILLRPGPRYVEGLAWLVEHLHPHGAHP